MGNIYPQNILLENFWNNLFCKCFPTYEKSYGIENIIAIMIFTIMVNDTRGMILHTIVHNNPICSQ